MYVKNIDKSVCEKQLISVFGKYKELQTIDIIYRYMKRGKMKGQAFIEFESKYKDKIYYFILIFFLCTLISFVLLNLNHVIKKFNL